MLFLSLHNVTKTNFSFVTVRRYEHNFEHAHYEHDRVDALAMSRLTFSPHVVDIYSFCGRTVLAALNAPKSTIFARAEVSILLALPWHIYSYDRQGGKRLDAWFQGKHWKWHLNKFPSQLKYFANKLTTTGSSPCRFNP